MRELDKFSSFMYINISDRVAETCEACNLKKAPAGAFLLKEDFFGEETIFNI